MWWWRNLKLKKFEVVIKIEVEENCCWKIMKLKKFKVQEICCWRNLKWKKFEVEKFEIEEIWSWSWGLSLATTLLLKRKSNSDKKVCPDDVNEKTEGNMGKENGN